METSLGWLKSAIYLINPFSKLLNLLLFTVKVKVAEPRPYTVYWNSILVISVLYLTLHGDYVKNVEMGTKYNIHEKASVGPVNILG